MAIKDYSTTPDLNTQISGINIAEGCAPSGINNAIRQLMADVKAEQAAKDAEQAAKDAEQDAAIEEAQGSIAKEKQLLEAQIRDVVPAGTVIAFAANSTPDGFLLCNGATVSRTTYAELFSAIGTIYGSGDGSSTFNLPNLTDKFIQGSGTAGTVKGAGLPNASGTFRHMYDTFVATGVFAATGAGGHCGQFSSNSYGGSAWAVNSEMNLSRANSIYGASTTVQPPALTMRYYIKY